MPTRSRRAANELGCDGRACDVTNEQDIIDLVEWTIDRHGPIDLFLLQRWSGRRGRPHRRRQRRVAEAMEPTDGASLRRTSRPAVDDRLRLGLPAQHRLGCRTLAALGSGPYSVTKAAQKLAEFLAITHGDDGIRASVLCPPQGVNTAMAPKSLGDGQTDGIIEADELAQTVVDTLRTERFYGSPPRGRGLRTTQGRRHRPLARRHAAAARRSLES
ncbi:MAG: hypothetical protein R2710_07930 [Acidimicrobiales bacterium]